MEVGIMPTAYACNRNQFTVLVPQASGSCTSSVCRCGHRMRCQEWLSSAISESGDAVDIKSNSNNSK